MHDGGKNWPFGGLQMFGYNVIHIDCPWSYEMYSEKGYEKSPQAHYDCMTIEELKALPVGLLASGTCAMVMWGVWPLLEPAYGLMRHWGFTPKTGGVWAKMSSTGEKQAFGTGYIVRSASEPYIIGTIGEPKARSKSVRNCIIAPVREHSQKPDQIYDDIEALWDGPYVDIFGRCSRPGWDVWGNEATKFDGEPAPKRKKAPKVKEAQPGSLL